MPITFSELLDDPALGVKHRRDIKRLYDAAKAAVRAGALTLEGHSLPASLNAWIARAEGEAKLPKTDTDVVDFSFADDDRLRVWRDAQTPKPKTRLSRDAHALLIGVRDLAEASRASLAMTNGKKDDVLAALSDLQGAVYTFLDTYDGVRDTLKLPARDLEPAQVEVQGRRGDAEQRPSRS
jgi:hypothetical protein